MILFCQLIEAFTISSLTPTHKTLSTNNTSQSVHRWASSTPSSPTPVLRRSQSLRTHTAGSRSRGWTSASARWIKQKSLDPCDIIWNIEREPVERHPLPSQTDCTCWIVHPKSCNGSDYPGTNNWKQEFKSNTKTHPFMYYQTYTVLMMGIEEPVRR